jgi:hypothetical protein
VSGLGLSSFSGQGDEDDLKRRKWDPGRRDESVVQDP